MSLAVLGAMLLSGCNSFDVLNSVTGSSHYVATENVRYATHDRGFFDIYLPADVRRDAPVVVFFYGGGWREGNRQDYEFVASELTRAGLVVVIPDYRLHPDVRFPIFVEDAAAAYQYVRENIGAYGVADNPWYVAGHSAGAHIAALLALDRSYLGDAHASIDGFIGLSGPYDFLPLEDGYLKTVFPEDLREASQPIRFVGSHVPRTLLIHGDDDRTVGIGNSERLAEAMRVAGVNVTMLTYEGVAHARVVAAMASPLSRLAPTAADIVEFVKRQSP